MPTYEYICKNCGEKFEHFQSMSSPPLNNHEGCKENGNQVERVISGGTGLIFKGSGFYLTDYKNKENKQSSDKKDTKPKKAHNSGKKKSTKQTEGKTS